MLHESRPLTGAEIARISEILGFNYEPSSSGAFSSNSLQHDVFTLIQKYGEMAVKITVDAMVYNKGKGPVKPKGTLISGLYSAVTPPVQREGYHERTYITPPTQPHPAQSDAAHRVPKKHKRA